MGNRGRNIHRHGDPTPVYRKPSTPLKMRSAQDGNRKAAIARAIQRLKKGIPYPNYDETNRRKFRIFLTEKGKCFANDVATAADEIDGEIIETPREARAHSDAHPLSMAYTSTCMADKEAHNPNDTDTRELNKQMLL